MSKFWDFCFNLIDPAHERVVTGTTQEGRDYATYTDEIHGIKFITQNLRKTRSANTQKILQERKRGIFTDTIWIGPRGGNFTHRVNLQVSGQDREGTVWSLGPKDELVAVYPDEVDVSSLGSK